MNKIRIYTFIGLFVAVISGLLAFTGNLIWQREYLSSNQTGDAEPSSYPRLTDNLRNELFKPSESPLNELDVLKNPFRGGERFAGINAQSSSINLSSSNIQTSPKTTERSPSSSENEAVFIPSMRQNGESNSQPLNVAVETETSLSPSKNNGSESVPIGVAGNSDKKVILFKNRDGETFSASRGQTVSGGSVVENVSAEGVIIRREDGTSDVLKWSRGKDRKTTRKIKETVPQIDLNPVRPKSARNNN